MRIEIHHFHHVSDADRFDYLIDRMVDRLLLELSAYRRSCGHRDHRPVNGKLTMSKTLNIGGTSTAMVTYTDKAGAIVPVVGVPAWSIDDSSVATVEPAADGMSAVVTAVAVGTATVTVVAEGDPTPGVDTITLTGTLNVVDEASGGTLTFS